MSGRRLVVFTVVWVLAACSTRASAQPATSTAALSADVRTIAKLTVSPTSLTFPDADPDMFPQVTSVGGALSITAKARATSGSQILLTVQAADDLRSGVDTIAAQAITWTTTGAGFTSGTLSSSAPVAVGRWTGSGVRLGTQTLYLANLWTYTSGTYTASLLYTLTAP